MTADKDTAQLLQIIAQALGTDARAFFTARDKARAHSAGEHHAFSHFARLFKAFRGLPDDATRLQAIETLEALAAPAPGSSDGSAH